MRLYGLQTGVADRNARRFLIASASTLRGRPRRRFCRACSASLLGCNRFPPEPRENTFGDFQLPTALVQHNVATWLIYGVALLAWAAAAVFFLAGPTIETAGKNV